MIGPIEARVKRASRRLASAPSMRDRVVDGRGRRERRRCRRRRLRSRRAGCARRFVARRQRAVRGDDVHARTGCAQRSGSASRATAARGEQHAHAVHAPAVLRARSRRPRLRRGSARARRRARRRARASARRSPARSRRRARCRACAHRRPARAARRRTRCTPLTLVNTTQPYSPELAQRAPQRRGILRRLDANRRRQQRRGAGVAQRLRHRAGLLGGARHQHALAEQRLAIVPAQLLAQAARPRRPRSAPACRCRLRARARAMSATVPTTVRCSGSDADWITAAGHVGARPCAINSCISDSSLRMPMKITSVCVAVASLAQSCALWSFCSRLGRGHVRDAARELAVRERDAGVGGRGHRRRHAGHDLELDAGRGQALGFFRAAAEQVRVAALEPRDDAPGARGLDHAPIDVGLALRGAAGALADEDAARRPARQCSSRSGWTSAS